MKKKSLLFRALAVVAAMMCALGVHAQEAYACYVDSEALTFYYDTLRSSREAEGWTLTFDLNTGSNLPVWYSYSAIRNLRQVVFDPSFADARPTSTNAWFQDMQYLESITGIEYLNTSEVTTMKNMFYCCLELTSLDVSGFDTRNVTDMSGMFYCCMGLTSLDVSGFNTANVTDMSGMFTACNLTSLDVSGFNTANVTDMSKMFYGCEGLTSLDVSNFNTSNVANMESMFDWCSGLTSLDLSGFNTSQVTDMILMFAYCSNLRTIYVGNDWSTAAVTNSYFMFRNCYNLVGGMGTAFDADHEDAEFAHLDGGTDNPGYFSEHQVEAYACYTPENTTLTFYYDKERSRRPGTTYDLNTDGNNPGWYIDSTFTSVTQVVFDPSFADAQPTATYGWFREMSNLQSITGMSYLNTTNVRSMTSMFRGCSGLTNLDVSHFNTSKVLSMNYMFRGCSSLTSLDLSSFSTSKVKLMGSMFFRCNNLQTIYVGDGWSTAAVTSSSYMFYNCTSLVGGQGTAYDASNPRDKTYAHIDGGPDNPGYFTAAILRGDVNGDNNVNISDVTTLINYLLSYNPAGVNLAAADCNQDNNVNISDVTALINYLLSHSW